MALINTKRTSVFLEQSVTLPVPPAGFIQTNAPVLVVPVFSTIESNEITGKLNSKASYVDTCRSSASFNIPTNIRETGTAVLDAVPDYAELMKIGGFEADTAVTDQYTLKNKTDFVKRGSSVIYLDGKKFTFTDTLVGALTINLTVGNLATMDCQVQGYIDDVKATDEANPTVAKVTASQLVVSCVDIYMEDGTILPCESIIITTNPEIQNTYTMGGVQGIKADTITDYSLMASVTLPVDSTKYKDNAELIESGTLKTMRIVIGADNNGVPIDGKSIVVKAETSRTVSYTDEDKNGILYRTINYKLEDSTVPALTWTTGKTAGL